MNHIRQERPYTGQNCTSLVVVSLFYNRISSSDRPWSDFWANLHSQTAASSTMVTANDGAGTVSILSGMPPAPDLSLSWATMSVSQAMFAITVKNVGFSPTTGSVAVTITLPVEASANELEGTGWSCSAATLVCNREDPLPALGSYPPIMLTLAFSGNASPGITLLASVSGGGVGGRLQLQTCIANG